MSDISNKTFEIGAMINDKWVILEFIGKGGMGEVYRAHQLNLKRDVAIKVISKEWVRSLEGDTDEASACLERFRREVEVVAQIRHPNVIQIFDHGFVQVAQADGETSVEYMVMEYIPGSTLRSTMSDEGFYPEEGRTREWLTDYFMPVIEGVDALHDGGIVHRDLKPENILLDRGKPKIADFGLARSCSIRSMTQSFDVKGTPPYMSPEHFMDLKRTDERADIYALGKILYEVIAGKMGPDTIPFKSARLPQADSLFYKEMDGIIQKATAEEKAERFSSIEELREALAAVLTKPQENPPMAVQSLKDKSLVWKATTVAAVLLVLIGLVALYLHEKPHIESPQKTSAPISVQQPESGQKPGESKPLQLTSPPPERLVGKDYDIMRLVPGGEITLPRDIGPEGGSIIKIKPFYMNETPITNQQYVDFLNKVLSRIRVESGVVRSNDQIWLMLGEVTRGYEPVVFRDGLFYVKNAAHSACPILRVTGYGALAYVEFYGLRLPTAKEWFFAVTKGKPDLNSSSPTPPDSSQGMMNEMHGHTQQALPSAQGTESAMPLTTPVIMFEPNAFGIRQLNENIGEWGVRINQSPAAKGALQPEYLVMGGPAQGDGTAAGKPSVVERNPWEAFEEVGFRCVREAPENAK